MHIILKFAATLAALGVLSASVQAQTAIVGNKELDDRVDDIQDDAIEEIERGQDDERFGPLGVIQGWRGSTVLSGAIVKSGVRAIITRRPDLVPMS